MNDRRMEQIREASSRLREAERGVRILRTVSWGPEVKVRFFQNGARELPQVSYPPFESEPEVRGAIRAAVKGIGTEDPVDRWLHRQADAIEAGALLLAAVGTPEFLERGRRLYGDPSTESIEGAYSSLELARTVDAFAKDIVGIDLGAPAPACHLASSVAQRMKDAVTARFGDSAPEVVVVDQLSANALAGPRTIRIRRDACFTDRDVYQLIQHEAFVHVCTSLNGLAQTELTVLGAGHPGTTQTQEGLAVFAELISGSVEPDRFRRLADRVLAIQMSIEGADFLDVYRFYLERTHSDEQAFENARRVFRGGILTGGAPFTKDVVYLEGLLRITHFLRVAVAECRADCLTLLFCGKLDIEDLPALSILLTEGLCRPPRFLPPWIEDRRFLVTYLTFSRFLNGVDFDRTREHYHELLAATLPPPTVSSDS